MIRWIVLALAVSRLAVAAPKGDDDDDRDTTEPDTAAKRAKAADRTARDHYRHREYEEAIRDYRRAHDALPDPLFLFDMAQAYRQLHDCANARDLYRDYLRDSPDADNRSRVEQFITDMDACAATPTALPAEPPPPPPASNSLQLAGLATAGLGAVLIGAGVYFSIQASDDASQLEAACVKGCSGAAVAEIDQAGRDASNNATLTYVFGGAAIATGATMFLWSTFHASGEPPVIAPASGGATVSARIRF